MERKNILVSRLRLSAEAKDVSVTFPQKNVLTVKRSTDMNLENLTVVHKVFGEGTISEQNGNYFKVSFPVGEKTFVYPDAFEKFLKLSGNIGGEEEQVIQADLDRSKAKKEKIAEAKNEENVRAMMHGIVIPGKEIVPNENEDEEGKSTSESEEN